LPIYGKEIEEVIECNEFIDAMREDMYYSYDEIFKLIIGKSIERYAKESLEKFTDKRGKIEPSKRIMPFIQIAKALAQVDNIITLNCERGNLRLGRKKGSKNKELLYAKRWFSQDH